MDKLFKLFGDISHAKLGGADSYADQLNCRYTVFVLSVFAVIATARVYVNEPISCFCPAEFESSQVAYVEKVCWTMNTFHLPIETELTQESRKRATQISYYQWVSLFFSVQAFLFYLPRHVWRMLNRKSGIAVSTITDAAIECQRQRDDGFDATVKYMTRSVARFLSSLARRRPGRCCYATSVFPTCGSYLTVVYLAVKLLYVVNIFGQLYLLNAFLSTDFHLYGIDVIRRMAAGEEWTTSARFPRVALCDFSIRKLGNVHRYTVQCALPMNLFYEMMFIFLWFWMVFVMTVVLCSLVQWIVVSVFSSFDQRYVKARLVDAEKVALDADVRRFTRNYLRRDGCFIIRLVAKNAGDRIAGELVAGLWVRYNEKEMTSNNTKKTSVIELETIS